MSASRPAARRASRHARRSPTPAAVAAPNVARRRRLAAERAALQALLRDLKDREEKYRLLVEHQTDLVVKVDAEGRFLYVSPAYCRTFGKSEQELLGETFMPLVHEEDLPATREAMKDLLIPPHRAYMEQRAMTVEGWRWFAWSDSAILGPAGDIVEIIGVGRDITERKESEALLRQSEERFAKSFHANPAPLVLSDIATGTFIDVNEHWVEMLGYPREEQIGRTSREVGIWADPGERDRAVALLRENGSFKDFPIEFLTRTGETRYALWSAEVVSLQGRAVMLSLIVDITERKRTEEALRRSEKLYRSVIDNIQDVFYRTDAAGRLCMVSPSGVRLLGYGSAEEMLGRPNEEFWCAPDRRKAFLERMRQHGRVSDFEVFLQRADGTPVLVATSSNFYHDDAGNVLGVEGIFRDITERKRAEEMLRQSEEKFSRLFKLSPDAISLSEPESGVLVDVNETFTELSGYSREELVGRSTLELGLFENPEARAELLERLLRAGHASNLEMECRRKDGTLLQCSISCQFIPIGDKRYLLSVIRDMTEFKRMQEMMIQTEKMVSVGGIAAGVAHELNNPLAIIVQTAQNMAQRLDPEFGRNVEQARDLGLDMAAVGRYMEARKVPSMVRGIQAAALRAASIIRHMLDFSRQDGSRRESCDIAAVADRALELAGSDYDLGKTFDFRKVRVIRRYEEPLPAVECSETEIEQVFLNLLRNAAQAMAMAEPPTADPCIVIRLAASDGMVRIEIEDNGPGVPPEVQRRVFEPFFTTKPPGIGTGLGLSVSYFIVTRGHGGRMWVDSEPGRGAVFGLELPVSGGARHGDSSRPV